MYYLRNGKEQWVVQQLLKKEYINEFILIKVKYGILEVNPGPGRYDPNIKPVKAKAPTYFFGEKMKTNSLMNMTGTNEQVGPATYGIGKFCVVFEFITFNL